MRLPCPDIILFKAHFLTQMYDFALLGKNINIAFIEINMLPMQEILLYIVFCS